ncbi:UNVERIFIED_CONTAM: hypothetical protein PYX00_000512 [Menopon gallinae]|uniref:Protein VAC14 homolog n=1 Tax=Menopon gallinae TaxID=328185 RepID=A0AAW2IAP5_9NEOP
MISERDFAPLSVACVRALNDKLHEKRKTAAVEVEKMVKDFAAHNDTVQIKRLLKVLGQDFALSQNPHSRKGGLIGLAAIAVALGKDTAHYIPELINPILACFSDSDLRVRYYACESLYNVVKVARGNILDHFTEIFSGLSKLAADPDQNVKSGSELLDRLLKDIVTESTSFNLVGFMPMLRERISTKNDFARQFIISWVSVLDTVPQIDMVLFLPDLLDGLFRILEDPKTEIKTLCSKLLGEFLRSIKQNPNRVDFPGMINILVQHAQSQDDLLQYTAITWIKEFVQLSDRAMVPYASGILVAILPCLSYESDSKNNIKETAKIVNSSLMKLISEEDEVDENGVVKNDNGLDLNAVTEVLTKFLMQTKVPTKVAVLKWIHYLYTKVPVRMYEQIEKLFPVLLKALSDSSDEVVKQDLKVLAEIVSSQNGNQSRETTGVLLEKNRYFPELINDLIRIFNTDRRLLDDRGSFIIRQLCTLLNSEDIYRAFAVVLSKEENLKFVSKMVDYLNTILLTSSELFELRTRLKNFKSKESQDLFVCLYYCWCHNPVATVALCFLTQNYTHACDLIRSFGNIEVTVEFLTEIDKLVQLLESPIFAYIRLELLDVPHNQSLVQALYGLLMLLPQTEAFQALRNRLDCIPSFAFNCDKRTKTNQDKTKEETLDFQALMQHFLAVQEKGRPRGEAVSASSYASGDKHV